MNLLPCWSIDDAGRIFTLPSNAAAGIQTLIGELHLFERKLYQLSYREHGKKNNKLIKESRVFIFYENISNLKLRSSEGRLHWDMLKVKEF